MEKTEVIAEVKSGWLSKINWTQIIAFVAMVLTMFGFDFTVEDQLKVVAAIGMGGQLVTIFFRVFKTKAVTKASAISMPVLE